MARTTHRFTQLTEGKEQKNHLFSVRKKQEIQPHQRRNSYNLTMFTWHLLPGAYYLYHYAKQYQKWQLSLVVIQKNYSGIPGTEHSYIEKYKPVNSPPEWLTEIIDKTVHPNRIPKK